MDVRGVLRQIPRCSTRAFCRERGPDVLPTQSTRPHPRPGAVPLRENQSVFPSRSGGHPGKAEKLRGAAVTVQSRVRGWLSSTSPRGGRHRTEIHQRDSGQTVGSHNIWSVLFTKFIRYVFQLRICLHTCSDAALHRGCRRHPENVPHAVRQTIVPRNTPGPRHHPGLHQGRADTPRIQTGAPDLPSLIFPRTPLIRNVY